MQTQDRPVNTAVPQGYLEKYRQMAKWVAESNPHVWLNIQWKSTDTKNHTWN